MTIFRRQLPIEARGIKLENRADNQLPQIRGTAAVFWDTNNRAGTQYQLWSDVFERIRPGAFDSSLQRGDDVRALQNHEPTLLLGRSVAGTLKLELQPYGLDYLIDTPDTQAGRDSIVSLSRGDMTGSSFAFRVFGAGQNWTEEKSVDGVNLYIRNVTDVELFDVGPVTYPAYSATAAGTRGQRSPSCFIGQRSAEHAAEVAEVRSSLDQWINENYYEPQARERLIALASAI